MVELASGGASSFRMVSLGGRRGPEPAARDYWIFFVGLPLIYSLWGAAVGIGPTRTMSFGGGFAYVSTHIAAAWWGNGAACMAVAMVLRRYRPPLWAVLVAGHALAWLPLYLFYLRHSEYFGSHFHRLTPDPRRPAMGLTLAYALHTLRYSTVPFLMIWFGAIYGYLLLTGVRFFSSAVVAVPRQTVAHPPPPREATANDGTGGGCAQPAIPSLRPAFLAGSRLGPDAEICAIKAEEHYIRIWSAAGGTDLLRYRLADAIAELAAVPGGQVHRSWWIRWDCAVGWRSRGRALEITLRNGMRVPVSLAYKVEALGALRTSRCPEQGAASASFPSGPRAVVVKDATRPSPASQ